jgi:serine protease Do/serine protease DegQ
VVEQADKISVTLRDGRQFDARMLGTDKESDVAVIQIPAEKLTALPLADSEALQVGDFVVAIGNPFGLGQTVTSGIVSALGRSDLGIEGYEDFIQTDASINPGNSGGALVDLSGRLVGINTAILAPSGGNVGIGFAIPVNMVRAVLEELIEHGEVRRGYLGVSVQSLNVELAEAFDVDRREGVVVVEVEPESAADRAGLETGDIIVSVRSRPIRRVTDFHSEAAVTFIGDELGVEVLRDGKVRKLKLAVTDDTQEQVSGRRVDPRLAGTELQNFRNREEAGLGAGVLVTDVDPESAAWRYGLRPGDVLVALNERAIRNIADLRDSARGNGQPLLFRVYRSGQFGYLSIR